MVWNHGKWERASYGTRHIGARPCHEGFVRINGDHLPITWIEKCDTQQVLTQHVVARDHLLSNGQVANGAVSAWSDLGAEPIRSTCAEPLGRPIRE